MCVLASEVSQRGRESSHHAGGGKSPRPTTFDLGFTHGRDPMDLSIRRAIRGRHRWGDYRRPRLGGRQAVRLYRVCLAIRSAKDPACLDGTTLQTWTPCRRGWGVMGLASPIARGRTGPMGSVLTSDFDRYCGGLRSASTSCSRHPSGSRKLTVVRPVAGTKFGVLGMGTPWARSSS